jgi:hypothetical protein
MVVFSVSHHQTCRKEPFRQDDELSIKSLVGSNLHFLRVFLHYKPHTAVFASQMFSVVFAPFKILCAKSKVDESLRWEICQTLRLLPFTWGTEHLMLAQTYKCELLWSKTGAERFTVWPDHSRHGHQSFVQELWSMMITSSYAVSHVTLLPGGRFLGRRT